MRVLVCGGRTYQHFYDLNRYLNSLNKEFPIDIIIHGAAKGADTLAEQWAVSKGKISMSFPAAWDIHGKSAGYKRNAKMLQDGRPNLVVAFPGGKGTENMIKIAEDAGVPVLKVWESEDGLYHKPEATDDLND